MVSENFKKRYCARKIKNDFENEVDDN